MADYLNVLFAFLTLQEPERTLRMAFVRMVAADTDCGYLRAFADKARTNPKYAPVREAWLEALAECGEEPSPEAPTTAPPLPACNALPLPIALYQG